MGVWGYVAGAKYAQLDVPRTSSAPTRSWSTRVLAPDDAWIVVHLDDNGMPGERVGLHARLDRARARTSRSRSNGVDEREGHRRRARRQGHRRRVRLRHGEQGRRAPTGRSSSTSKELAKVVTVREFGVKAEAGEAAIEVADQPGVTGHARGRRARSLPPALGSSCTSTTTACPASGSATRRSPRRQPRT